MFQKVARHERGEEEEHEHHFGRGYFIEPAYPYYYYNPWYDPFYDPFNGPLYDPWGW